MDVPTARTLVRALSSRGALDASSRDVATRLVEPSARDALLAVADALRVRGLVLARLANEGVIDALPEDAAAALRSALHVVRRVTVTQDLERERVVARLRRAGIPALLLKGAALRVTAYADPCERSAGDIDLLVDAAHLSGALVAMVEAGYAPPDEAEADTYRRYHFHHRLTHPMGHVVELHWALTEPDAPVRLDAAEFMAEAVRVERRQAPPVLVPRPEHTLLHLAAQNADDPARAFARAVDVDRLVATSPSLDWDRVVTGARTGGLATATWSTLRLAASLHGTAAPNEALWRLAPPAVVRAHLALLDPVSRATGALETRDSDARLLQLWTLAGDHGLAAATSWLGVQGFLGPRERVRIEQGSRWAARRRAAHDVLGMVARQVRTYATVAVARCATATRFR